MHVTIGCAGAVVMQALPVIFRCNFGVALKICRSGGKVCTGDRFPEEVASLKVQ